MMPAACFLILINLLISFVVIVSRSASTKMLLVGALYTVCGNDPEMLLSNAVH